MSMAMVDIFLSCYILHMNRLIKWLKQAYHGANDGLKIEFLICGTQNPKIGNREPYKSGIGGSSFNLF